MRTLAERDDAVRAFCERWPTLDEVRASASHHKDQKPLEPLGKPCHDCAVTCNFYLPYAAMLSLLPPEEIAHHSARWFCHNHGNRACAGNIGYQAEIAALGAHSPAESSEAK